MSNTRTTVRAAALVAALGGAMTITATPADASSMYADRASTTQSASSMVGTGVTPSALGVSSAGGVLVSLSALAMRSSRRRLGASIRP